MCLYKCVYVVVVVVVVVAHSGMTKYKCKIEERIMMAENEYERYRNDVIFVCIDDYFSFSLSFFFYCD